MVILLGLLAFSSDAVSEVFFVSTSADDANSGGAPEEPFRTVQRCVYKLQGLQADGTVPTGGATQAPYGSECRLRAGVYKSDTYILVEHLKGESGNPYVVGKYEEDEGEVIFEGTVDVFPNCDKDGDSWVETTADFALGGAGSNHFTSATLDEGVEPWQLFVGHWGVEGELFVPARWPDGADNGRWDDKSMFQSKTWKRGSGDSQYVDIDEDAVREPGLESTLVDDGTSPALADSGIDATGDSGLLCL